MSAEEDIRTRRTEGVRVRGRSARVVNEVLLATAEELGRVGYAALRVDDVAARAGVNKTTIYRRWPTKPALVGAALRHFSDAEEVPNTGSLREDLLIVLRRMVQFWSSPIGGGLVRMIQAESTHPEVEQISRERRRGHRAARAVLFDAAIARGEIPAETNIPLLIELTFSPVVSRMLRSDDPVDEAYLQSVVDFVVQGAKAGHAKGMDVRAGEPSA